MIVTLALGLRLAWGGNRLRAMLVSLGNALAAAAVVVTFSVAGSLTANSASRDWTVRALAAAVVAFLLMPIGVLLLSVGRLSAGQRDRNLGSLRLLGLTSARTRLVAATENVVLAAGGALIGAALGAILAPGTSAAVLRGLLARVPAEGSPRVGAAPVTIASFITAFALVAAVAAVVSLAPARSLRASGRPARLAGVARRPSLLRALPFAAGLLVLALILGGHWRSDDYSSFLVFVAGVVLLGVGVTLVLPLLVRAAAELLRRWRPTPVVLLATRRLAAEPSGTMRIVSGFVLAVFMTTGSMGVVAAFKQVSQYQGAVAVQRGGPQLVQLSFQRPPSASTLSALRGVKGVGQVIGWHGVQTPCQTGAGAIPAGQCANGIVGSCAQLRALAPVDHCDGRAAWIHQQGDGRDLRGPIRVEVGGHRTVTVAVSRAPINGRDPESASTYGSQYFDFFIPAASPALRGVHLGALQYAAVMTGGSATPDRVDSVLGGKGYVSSGIDDLEIATVNGYQSLAWLVTAIALGIGLATYLFSAVDHAVGRRRQVAAQRSLGVSLRTLRLSQLLQVLVPLGIGVVLAAAGGFLAGTTYLVWGQRTSGSSSLAIPIGDSLLVVVFGLLGSVLVAAATLPTLGRRLDPSLLRRE